MTTAPLGLVIFLSIAASAQDATTVHVSEADFIAACGAVLIPAGDGKTTVPPSAAQIACLDRSGAIGRAELSAGYLKIYRERCVESHKKTGTTPPADVPPLTSYVQWYPEECEAVSLCARDPTRIAAWGSMAGEYQTLLSGGEAAAEGHGLCGAPASDAFLPPPDVDMRARFARLYVHPEMNDVRKKKLYGYLTHYSQLALRRRVPHLSEADAQRIAAAMLATGDPAQALAAAPNDEARRLLGGYFDGFRGASPAVVTPGAGGHASKPARAAERSLADTGEEAERLAVQYSPESAAMIKALLQRGPSNQSVDVLVSSRREADDLRHLAATEWGVSAARLRSVRFLTCPENECPQRLSAWTRDHYLLVRGRDGSFVLRPRTLAAHSQSDSSLLERIMPDILKRRSDITFQGGEIVTAPGRTFISDDVRARNPQYDRAELEAIFSRETGRPATLVPRLTAWPHIDLYLTPVGEKTVLVGDSGLGVRMARAWGKGANAARMREVLGKGSAARTEETLSVSESDAERLDDLAAKVASLGFTVERVPIITGRCCGKMPIITYNNVFQSGRHVYVGEFGLDVLDSEGRAAYERHGLHVTPLPALELARMGGAIHCAINALPR